MTHPTVAAFLSRLTGVKGSGAKFIANCPGHDDKERHLTVTVETDKILLCDHSGHACPPDKIVAAVGLQLSDLFLTDKVVTRPVAPAKPAKPRGKVIKETTWRISEPNDTDTIDHVRLDWEDGSKTFVWRRNGKDGLDGVPVPSLPLFRASPIEALAADWIITEGEKSAEAVAAMGYEGYGTVTGASSTPEDMALLPLLSAPGRIFLWPDNDNPGRQHMDRIAQLIETMGLQAFQIVWPEAPEKGDAYDYLSTGKPLAELLPKAMPYKSMLKCLDARDGVICQKIPLPGDGTITMTAENIRKERTGVHAKISVSLDGKKLAYDTFNITRNEERDKLAKAAAKQTNGTGYDQAALKSDLDQFADAVWDRLTEEQMGGMMDGDHDPKAPTMILHPFLIQGGGTILFAPPGRGKSWISIAMAVSIDAGVQSLWRVEQGKVMVINLERSKESMQRRLSLVNQALGLPKTRPLLFMNCRGHALADIATAATKTAKRYGVKVVFLDSISRSGLGDLNTNESANKIVDTLNLMSHSWLAIGHTPRGAEDHIFGSQHFDAGCDIAVKMVTQEESNALGVGLEIVKGNDVAKQPMMRYAMSFNEIGLTGIRRAGESEYRELLIGQKRTVTQQITDYLNEQGEATATQIAKDLKLNRANVSLVLGQGVFVKTHKEGRDQFYGLQYQDD